MAKPVASCQNPSIFTPALAIRVRLRERRKFITMASSGARTISNARPATLRTCQAAKKNPAYRHDNRLRMPLQASSMPTVVPTSWMRLPDCRAGIPRKWRLWSTFEATNPCRPRVRRLYVPEGKGAERTQSPMAVRLIQFSGTRFLRSATRLSKPESSAPLRLTASTKSTKAWLHPKEAASKPAMAKSIRANHPASCAAIRVPLPE